MATCNKTITLFVCTSLYLFQRQTKVKAPLQPSNVCLTGIRTSFEGNFPSNKASKVLTCTKPKCCSQTSKTTASSQHRHVSVLAQMLHCQKIYLKDIGNVCLFLWGVHFFFLNEKMRKNHIQNLYLFDHLSNLIIFCSIFS